MKAGRFVYLLPILFAGTTLFYFSTCPIGNIGSGNLGFFNSGSSNLYKPSWAVSQPGNVYIYVQAPSSLNYSESSGLNYTLPLIYVNNIYTMSNSQLEVSYYVYSYALSSPYSGNFNAEPATYNSSSDQLIPSNSTIGNIEVSLSPGLLAVPSQIPIVVEYNISNVVTNILIPLQLNYSNSSITLSEPVYYSSSPITPTSSNINVNEIAGNIYFSISFQDSVGCFSNVYSNSQATFNVNAELRIIGSTSIDIPNGGEGFSCNPTQNVSISSSTISCIINLQDLGQKYQLQNLLNSNLGVPAYILMNLSYNCYEENTYNIPVNKT
ncbi:MAG: hypothetical protein RXO36_01140 [Candidatus Nanopusillus acidilobi]